MPSVYIHLLGNERMPVNWPWAERRRRSSSAPIPYLCAIFTSPRKTAELPLAEKCYRCIQVCVRMGRCDKRVSPRAHLAGRLPPRLEMARGVFSSPIAMAGVLCDIESSPSFYKRGPNYVLSLPQRREGSNVKDP